MVLLLQHGLWSQFTVSSILKVNLPAPAERQAIDQAVCHNNFINWPHRVNEPINEFHEAGYIAGYIAG